MARDRKRAKQRRERRSAPAAGRPSAPGGERPGATNQPIRANVPGGLDHASGDADEFEAALLRGAGGQAAAAEDAEAEDDSALEASPETGVEDGAAVAGDDVALAGDDAALAEDALSEEGPLAPGGDGGGPGRPGAAAERASGAPLQGGNRAAAFLRASWAELQRVQWPDRRQVTQATAVVLGFVAVAGAYLGLADFVAKEIVEFIL